MKKMLLIAMMAAGLVACTTSPAPKEDTKLKDAYSACINTAEGNPDKIEACQSVLNVLKKDKQHQQLNQTTAANGRGISPPVCFFALTLRRLIAAAQPHEQ